MAQHVSIERPVDGADLDQCLYAAAFLLPGISDVQYEEGTWLFVMDEHVDQSVLAQRLDALISRYATATGEPDTLFEFAPQSAADMPGVSNITAVAQPIGLGLNVFHTFYARLIRFLDDAMLRRFGPVFRPIEEAYPNVIPMESLSDANHLSSFPEHLNFVSHLDSDIENLDRFSAIATSTRLSSADDQDITFAPSDLVHNPSTCYHCYASKRGMDLTDNTAITAITKCHRYEASNHSQLGRLMEFSLREVIFLGTPDYVRETRAQSLKVVEDLVRDWHVFGSLGSASDPFFSSDYSKKATHQQRLALKYEYRALLPPHKPISILSSNLHGPTFSKAFSITLNGRPINTGCIGFGLERFAFAIIAQHGDSPDHWPEKLAADYSNWLSADPLGSL